MSASASSVDAEALYRSVFDQLQAACGHAVRAGKTVLIGIHSGGAWVAERLARELGAASFGVVNVGLHRDDYAKKGLHSQAQPTALPFAVDNQHIVLIDDVLSTGRTIRAAINELYDYGRPASIELAVLADRAGRELPIAARFMGASLDVPAHETLVLKREANGRFVFLTERPQGRAAPSPPPAGDKKTWGGPAFS